MKHILILMWLNSYQGGAIAMQEFDNLDACISASNQVLQAKRGSANFLTAICVPKSKSN